MKLKWHLLLGRKAMINLDSILKSRDITLLTKVHLVKAMVFPVVMYGCESWTVKKAECRKTDAFELWCWRLFKVPWTVRRSILKEIHPEYSLKGLMLKPKLQYFGYLRWRTDSLEKPPDSGKDLRQEEKGMTIWDDWVASPTQWLWVWVNSGSWWWTGQPGVLQSMGLKGLGHDWATELNGGFFGGSEVEKSAWNAEDLGLILGQEDPGGNPLRCSCLENSIDRGTWQAIVHGISKCWTQLND